MKHFILLALISIPIISTAQNATEINFFMRDANGRILQGLNNNQKIEGSPLLLSDFCNASIVSSKGKRYNGILSNINLETNELIFETPSKQIMAVNLSISRIEFEDSVADVKKTFLSGFSPIDRLTEKSFYQLLDSGAVLLLKSIQINSSESRGYAEAVVTKVYEKSFAYYMSIPEKGLVKVPRTITDIPNLLEKEKKEKLANYIRSNQLRSKNESDLIKLMSFYKTL